MAFPPAFSQPFPRPFGGVTAAGPTVLIYDTFTDTDGVLITNHTPNTGGPWVALLNGSRGVINTNRAIQTAGTTVTSAFTCNLGVANLKITANLMYTAASAPNSIISVFIRSTGIVGTARGFEMALYNPGSAPGLYIFERDGGFVQRAFAARAYSPNVPVPVTVTASGNTISITDGTVTASYTTTLFNANTHHGFIVQTGAIVGGVATVDDYLAVTL